MAETSTEAGMVEVSRYRSLPQALKVVVVILFTAGIGFVIWWTFHWSVKGWVLDGVMYYYLLYTTFSTCVFLTMPARKKDRNRIPWYDLVFAALVFGICLFFALNYHDIGWAGWVPPRSTLTLVLACIIGVLALEGGRRMTGLPLMIICIILGVFPLFAEYLPGVFFGVSMPFPYVIGAFAYGKMGMLGLPAQTMGDILIGFLIFAGVLIASGAGDFFLNLALGLLGRFRGGPAKVAVLASGFFGSLSGATTANIVATGSVTIPAMKRLGYPYHYAGAIEAVSSLGGAIMPPVMGMVAFIMSILTGIPYTAIIIAAIIPAVLYYYGLLVQVDAYAARVGLKGLPREEIPSILKTLKEGWPCITVLFFLVFGLIYMRWGALAPIYATALMLVLSFTRRETMLTPKKLVEAVVTIGNLITYVMAILLPIGFLMVGLQVTGMMTAVTAQIVAMTGENAIVLLLMAVAICYLLGMVGMAFIPYIVLAVTAIPAVAGSTGLSLLGLHLFMVYYLLTGAITPPVCIAAFVASAVAGSPPMKTGFIAMRLAVVLYFVPWFFVFNPALILEGPILETVYLFVLCLVGIWILASGLEGYLLKVGRLKLWVRPLLIAGGFLIAFPDWMTSIAGAILTALLVAIILIRKKTAAQKLTTVG